MGFIYDRRFGSHIPAKLQKKLNELQGRQAGDHRTHDLKRAIGEDGTGDWVDAPVDANLSSRVPWVRLWTAVEGYDFVGKGKDKKRIAGDTVIFAIGNNTFRDYYQVGTDFAGSGAETEIKDSDFNDVDPDLTRKFKLGEFLGANHFFHPNAGITNVSSRTSGFWGAIKETTVQFKVYDMYSQNKKIII